MVFSSNAFLFFFLPIVLGLYYLLRKNRTAANAVLCLMSILFYAWGEPRFVLVMLGSIVLNWLVALGIENCRARAKALMIAGIVMNVCILGVFKYTGFAIRNINSLFRLNIVDPKIALPIGISFFTFQAMSYIIDVYRGKAPAQKHLLGVALYISFFPQLIAGPIVRYETVAQEITSRKETLDDFTEGVRRFLVGLSKKAILANALGSFVDRVFALPASEAGVVLSWAAAVAYLVQVYYDFSGYSDMAIGLGRMFGFHFLENFTWPFVSKSVAEFWRRWHISMTTWFRDYVFFPLGGSRVKSKWRLAFNLFMVWALTGLWHGAEWTYVCWGITFFLIQYFEKWSGLGKTAEKHWWGHIYAMVMVVIVTVLIRSADMPSALAFYRNMFGLGGAPFVTARTGIMLKENLWYLILSLVLSLPVGAFIKAKLRLPDGFCEVVSGVLLALVSFIAITYVVSGGYNPFIYFNF